MIPPQQHIRTTSPAPPLDSFSTPPPPPAPQRAGKPPRPIPYSPAMPDRDPRQPHTVFVRTGARRVSAMVATQPNWLLKLAAALVALLVVAFVLVVVVPIALIFFVVAFAWSLTAGALSRLRARLEGRGAISTREGRRNVRVVQRGPHA